MSYFIHGILSYSTAHPGLYLLDDQLFVFIIVIPLPLFFAQTIYGTKGLTAWVVIGILWAFLSAFTVVIYPLYESRVALGMVLRGLIKVCGGIQCLR